MRLRAEIAWERVRTFEVNELAERGIRLVVPSPEAVKSRYKQRLFAWAQRHSILPRGPWW